MVLSLSAVYPLSHGLRAPKLQPSQELLSPTMKETSLCGTGRQTATGMPLTFVKRMVRHRVHGTDFRLSKKLPGREWAALDTKCLTAYFQASCELTMLETGPCLVEMMALGVL